MKTVIGIAFGLFAVILTGYCLGTAVPPPSDTLNVPLTVPSHPAASPAQPGSAPASPRPTGPPHATAPVAPYPHACVHDGYCDTTVDSICTIIWKAHAFGTGDAAIIDSLRASATEIDEEQFVACPEFWPLYDAAMTARP